MVAADKASLVLCNIHSSMQGFQCQGSGAVGPSIAARRAVQLPNKYLLDNRKISTVQPISFGFNQA